jgi:thiol-disulfide isomerase/thioredoxin
MEWNRRPHPWRRILFIAVFVSTFVLEARALVFSQIVESADLVQVNQLDRPVDLKSLNEKKARLVILWATWCQVCLGEMKDLKALHKKFDSKGLQIIAINVDENIDAVREFLNKNEYPFPIFFNRKMPEFSRIRKNGVPQSFIYDDKKVSRYYERGYNSEKRMDLNRTVAEILSGGHQQ